MNAFAQRINEEMQLEILLDCIENLGGTRPQLNANRSRSQHNFRFIREEKTPSCSLFHRQGVPFLHDFGTGLTYNYISAYAQTYGLSNAQAFKDIQNQYLQFESIQKRSPQSPLTQASKGEEKKLNTPIRSSSRFKAAEVSYFAQFGISPQLLRQYGVTALRQYKKLSSSSQNPVFVFQADGAGPDDGKKVYQPLSKQKAYKWFWTGTRTARFISYGIEQLPNKASILFLTEGLKDTLSIKAHTPYQALALDSASTLPPEEWMEKLQHRFQHIVVAFDGDCTGRKRAEQLALSFGLKVLYLPNGQDISDFFQGHTLADFKKLSLKNFTPRKLDIQKYLSEENVEPQVFDLFRESGDLILPAPTGSGKNEVVARFIAQELKRNPKARFFNGFPNNLSAEAKTKEYSQSQNNYSQLSLDIGLLDQYTLPKERQHIGSFPVVNFVYNSFDQIEPLIGEGDYLFLDEFHKWITQSDIAPQDQINKILQSPAKKVFLSGTPFQSFQEEFQLEEIQVNRVENPKIHIQAVELLGRDSKRGFNHQGEHEIYLLAAQNLLQNLDSSESKLHIIYLNDKEGLERLAESARGLGFETECIYSDDRIKAESEAWACLTSAKAIPMPINQGKILFFTSLAYDSLNLNNPAEELGIIAIFGEAYIENLCQALRRPRKVEELEVLYFRAAEKKDKMPFQETYQQHRAIWQSDYEILRNRIENISPLALLKLGEKERKHYLHDVSRVLNEDLSFNRLACVMAYEQKKARKETFYQKCRRLNAFYSIKPWSLEWDAIAEIFSAKSKGESELSVSETAFSSVEIQNWQEKRKQEKIASAEAAKALMLQHWEFTLAYLSQLRIDPELKSLIRNILGSKYDYQDLQYLAFKQSITLDRSGQRALKKYAQQLLYLAKYFRVNQNLVKIAISSQARTLLRQISLVKLLESDPNQDCPSESSNRFYYQAIQEAFTVGESYSRAEREALIQKTYAELGHPNYTSLTRQKLFQSLFFTREDRRDKSIRRKEILGLITVKSLAELHGLEEQSLVFTDKKKVLKSKEITHSTFDNVGICPF